MTTPYTTGTITLTNNSATVTGTGTGWQTALIAGGTIYPAAPGGNALPISVVNSNTQITAAVPWRGASGTYSYALMRDTAYGEQTVANAQALAEYLARLNKPTLAAFAALADTMAANRLAYATGPNSMAWSNFTDLGRSLVGAASGAAVWDAVGATSPPDKAFRRGNVLGTVSQASGVPTGALIERGSNANGNYVRFADGLQICRWGFTTSATEASTWTFPAAFVSTGGLQVFGVANRSSVAQIVTVGLSSANAALVSSWTPAGARVAWTAYVMAMGFWF